MAYMGCYKNSPTAGGTDGTLVASGTPISVGPLNAADNEESSVIKLAVRCDEGYATDADTVITPTGTTAAKWALALDSEGSAGTFGDYGAALTITATIDDTNTIFWAKAKATSDESPATDTTVTLEGTCATIVAS